MLAPVVIFAYKRKSHLEQMIVSLEKNYLSEQTVVYIYGDNFATIEDKEQVEETRDYLRKLINNHTFKELNINLAVQHKGLASSVIDGVTDIIAQFGKVIVIEDDLILAKDFLSYMNSALDFYDNNEKIWSISGFSFPMKSLKHYPHDIFYTYCTNSWGWGTWKNRWDQVEWSLADYESFKKDKKRIKRFLRGGTNFLPMLDRQMNHVLDSWAIRWYYSSSIHDSLTIWPVHSKVINKGFDGSGTHCGVGSEYDISLKENNHEERFEEIELDPKITREMYLHNSDTIRKKLKRGMAKIFMKKQTK